LQFKKLPSNANASVPSKHSKENQNSRSGSLGFLEALQWIHNAHMRKVQIEIDCLSGANYQYCV
jgi:hypothetical protein